jgi:hypothetical protein
MFLFKTHSVSETGYCLRLQVEYTQLRPVDTALVSISGHQVKVKIILQLTVSQSVCLGVEPHLGLMTRYFLIVFCESCGPVNFGAPSLTGGLVCRLSVKSLEVGHLSVYTYKQKL